MKAALDTTVIVGEKSHSFGNNFNRARKFAKANAVKLVTVTHQHYWNKRSNLIYSPFSVSYSV